MTAGIDWNVYRAHFPIFREWAYFGWASVAPLSRSSADAMIEQVTGVRDQGVSPYRDWYRAYEGVRDEAAALVGASAEEIAMVKNTSEGVSTIAAGLALEPGDNVIKSAGCVVVDVQPVNGFRSGIVAFDAPGESAKALARMLESKHVLVNPREGRLRAAVHAWNNEYDIERLVAGCRSACGSS